MAAAGFHPGNVENKWSTFQDGICKAAFPAFAEVATEAESGYAQAGRHFAVLTY
jgi:hypothetical protein